MFPHQNASPSGSSRQVNKVAKRALAYLAATQRESMIASSDISASPEAAPLVARLYAATTSQNKDALGRAVAEILKAGVSVQEMTAHLLPAVASQLGQDWESDTVSISIVTIGCARLQTEVRQLEAYATHNSITQHAQRMKCLVVVPEGAQHTLGAVVLATELRQAGSYVQLSVGGNTEEMVRLAGATPYDVIMISAAVGQELAPLRALVAALRPACPASKIVLGGGLLGQHATLATLVRVDIVTNNWKEALLLSAQGVSHGQKAL